MKLTDQQFKDLISLLHLVRDDLAPNHNVWEESKRVIRFVEEARQDEKLTSGAGADPNKKEPSNAPPLGFNNRYGMADLDPAFPSKSVVSNGVFYNLGDRVVCLAGCTGTITGLNTHQAMIIWDDGKKYAIHLKNIKIIPKTVVHHTTPPVPVGKVDLDALVGPTPTLANQPPKPKMSFDEYIRRTAAADLKIDGPSGMGAPYSVKPLGIGNVDKKSMVGYPSDQYIREMIAEDRKNNGNQMSDNGVNTLEYPNSSVARNGVVYNVGDRVYSSWMGGRGSIKGLNLNYALITSDNGPDWVLSLDDLSVPLQSAPKAEDKPIYSTYTDASNYEKVTTTQQAKAKVGDDTVRTSVSDEPYYDTTDRPRDMFLPLYRTKI